MDDHNIERLTNLEIKLAFQDDYIRQLDEFVRVLSARLSIAEASLAELRQSLRSPAPSLDPTSEPPPHY